MVEKLKNWVMQNIAIVITIMIVISTAVLSFFVPDNIEKIFDKIFSYLGVVAIPLVVWYLGNQKELNEQKRFEEEQEQTIIHEVKQYKNNIISFLEKTKEGVPTQSIDDELKDLPEDSEDYDDVTGMELIYIRKINDNICNIDKRCKDVLLGSDPNNFIRLLALLQIVKYNEGDPYFPEMPEEIKEIHQYFEKLIEKVKNGEYDIQIREFLKERYKK